MKHKLFASYFEPRLTLKTGSPDYSETYRHPTPEQVQEAERIGNKFRLWLVLHPDYFGEELVSFNNKLQIYRTGYLIHSGAEVKWDTEIETDYILRVKMCHLCPHYLGNVDNAAIGATHIDSSYTPCPEVTPRFFGMGVVKMVEAKTDAIAKKFPCLEWVRHV